MKSRSRTQRQAQACQLWALAHCPGCPSSQQLCSRVFMIRERPWTMGITVHNLSTGRGGAREQRYWACPGPPLPMNAAIPAAAKANFSSSALPTALAPEWVLKYFVQSQKQLGIGKLSSDGGDQPPIPTRASSKQYQR